MNFQSESEASAAIPLACDMSVFDDAQRQQHIQLVHQLFDSRLAVEELADGFTWQFADQPEVYEQIAQFISGEHRCCPFFHFTLDVLPGRRPILKITGPAGVKEFVRAELLGWIAG